MTEDENYSKKDYAIMSVKIASKILGIPDELTEVTFRGENFFKDTDLFAIFVKKGYWIVFNEVMVKCCTPIEVMIAGFHETRHAYQQLIIDLGAEVPFYNEIPKERIEKWRNEGEMPIMPKGRKTFCHNYIISG